MFIQGKKIAFAITLATVISADFAIANPIAQTPPPAPKTGTSGRPQSGGATRPGESKCPNANTRPIAFMPDSLQTTLASPIFWFYVPYSPNDVDSFSFVILDEQDRYVIPPKNIKLSGTPGFISLSPPSQSFEVGKRYRWYFSIYCDPQNEEDRISWNGTLQRIASTSTENVDWYRPLLFLAERRRTNSIDPELKAEWDKLMESLNFSNISSQPLVPCCSLN
ncbi:DUF928 domain-containing protein [Argonema galeatum]|uniref:DUF928 domain-containing protein n=1 Tax=Argonema galeatum TaxID=2942762 RepID=UPI002010F3A2|nr:DUF928 domain-containing protein [Argonema galeatum]MCL1463894.1 DUF928 domain-containing protein [Argonema galeatum A003/A1]